MPDYDALKLLRVELIADAWASIDGRLEEFRAGRKTGDLTAHGGHYAGYTAEAEELIRRLEKRGLQVVFSGDGYAEACGRLDMDRDAMEAAAFPDYPAAVGSDIDMGEKVLDYHARRRNQESARNMADADSRKAAQDALDEVRGEKLGNAIGKTQGIGG